jgi:hypothetical protein
MNVVTSTPADRESPNWDLRRMVRETNRMKLRRAALRDEGSWRALTPYNADIIFLEKTSNDGADTMALCINKDWHLPRTVRAHEFPPEARRYARMIAPCAGADVTLAVPPEIHLRPAEIVLFSD